MNYNTEIYKKYNYNSVLIATCTIHYYLCISGGDSVPIVPLVWTNQSNKIIYKGDPEDGSDDLTQDFTENNDNNDTLLKRCTKLISLNDNYVGCYR